MQTAKIINLSHERERRRGAAWINAWASMWTAALFWPWSL